MLRKVFVLNIDEMECSSILSNTTSFLTWLNWKTSNDSKPIKRNQATSKYLSSELSISCRYSVEVLLKHYSVSYTSQRISNGWWFNNSLFHFSHLLLMFYLILHVVLHFLKESFWSMQLNKETCILSIQVAFALYYLQLGSYQVQLYLGNGLSQLQLPKDGTKNL